MKSCKLLGGVMALLWAPQALAQLTLIKDKEGHHIKGSPIKFETTVACNPDSLLGIWLVKLYNTCYPNPDGSPAYYETHTLTLFQGGQYTYQYPDGSSASWTYYVNENCDFRYNLPWGCTALNVYPPWSPSYENTVSCGCLTAIHTKQ